ncbi:hypothetical protein [Kitasatospora albolonga]|uniref:hypothetical protein n=1 Tax=Kitasatospora albolonga TaxID=68173 RepID=UPI0031E85431
MLELLRAHRQERADVPQLGRLGLERAAARQYPAAHQHDRHGEHGARHGEQDQQVLKEPAHHGDSEDDGDQGADASSMALSRAARIRRRAAARLRPRPRGRRAGALPATVLPSDARCEGRS